MKVCTVLIPCFNRQSLLNRCIESFASNFDYIDIIVVDDGSSPPISLCALPADYPVTIVRLSENVGRFSALKQGCGHVSTEYLLVFDSDDIWVGGVAAFAQIESGGAGWVFSTSATNFRSGLEKGAYSYFYLRYLSGVSGDLKEICRSEDFRTAVNRIIEVNQCRVPTTLIWMLAFGDRQILFVNEVVCIKSYLPAGMTNKSFFLRLANARYMYSLYDLLLKRSLAECASASLLFRFSTRKLAYYLLSKVYDPHH